MPEEIQEAIVRGFGNVPSNIRIRCACCNIHIHNVSNLYWLFPSIPICRRCIRTRNLNEFFSTPVSQHIEFCVCTRCLFIFQTNTDWISRIDTSRDGLCRGICTYCLTETERYRNYASYINDYYYKPQPIFHDLGQEDPDKTKLYLGVELEYNLSYSTWERDGMREKIVFAISEFIETQKTIYLKNDCSCSAFEVVSHPATLLYHHEKFNWFELFKLLNNERLSATANGIGLHIHFNKTALTHLEQKFLIVFFGRNHSWIEDFSRRSGYVPFNFPDTEGQLDRLIDSPIDRYYALNFMNRNTIEVRTFQSTLKLQELFACLEFVHASIQFTKSLSRTWKNDVRFLSNEMNNRFLDIFINFITDNTKMYTFLKEYIDVKLLSQV